MTPAAHDAGEERWSPAAHLDSIALSQAQWWAWAVDLSAQRMREGHGRQQQIDARFFVLALRQLRDATQIGSRAIAMPAKRQLQAALTAFDQQFPDVEHARDVLMHFGEYSAGVGKKQLKMTKSTPADLANKFATQIGYNPALDEVRVGVDLYVFNVADVLRESPRLIEAIHRAGTSNLLTDGATLPPSRRVTDPAARSAIRPVAHRRWLRSDAHLRKRRRPAAQLGYTPA